MSPTSNEPRPGARRPEPAKPEHRPLSERERWALVHASYPVNRGIPHSVELPVDVR